MNVFGGKTNIERVYYYFLYKKKNNKTKGIKKNISCVIFINVYIYSLDCVKLWVRVFFICFYRFNFLDPKLYLKKSMFFLWLCGSLLAPIRRLKSKWLVYLPPKPCSYLECFYLVIQGRSTDLYFSFWLGQQWDLYEKEKNYCRTDMQQMKIIYHDLEIHPTLVDVSHLYIFYYD